MRFLSKFRTLVLLTALSVAPALGQWIEQGPGPILFGQDEGIPNNPVSGAINWIVLDPTNANITYLATVNGGVWKTTNATADPPVWTPLTDTQLPGLSIASLTISPVNSNVLYAGTGSTSSFGSDGSAPFGVAKTTDAGATWTVLASATFAGKRISSIVATRLLGGNIVLAANLFERFGLYRSTDGGASFTRISGTPASGLPDGGVSSIVADPADPNRFYVGVPSNYLNTGATGPGIYTSVDGGVTWTPVNNGLTGQTASLRILLSVHNSPGNNAVYAMIIGNTSPNTGKLLGVFRSPDQGNAWTSMGLPSPDIFPGAQGSVHGAITAHPTDPNVVFIAGDRQDLPTSPNANGCMTFSANVFRGTATGPSWVNVVCAAAQGTSPHADSRSLAFAMDGSLWMGNDGGIFRLIDPDDAKGQRHWASLNNGIRPTEFHSVAYDVLSNVAIGGAQDVGSSIQSTPGSLIWETWLGGDGGNVAIDADQTAHPGMSIRYTSAQFLQIFNRSFWDAANTNTGFALIGLNITSGAGAGRKLTSFDPNVQFYNPYVLNNINPSRMLIGTASIYESMDRGDTLANLGFTGKFITALTYGGRLNGNAFPDVFYVGMRGTAAPFLLHRVTLGGPITAVTAYPGNLIRAMAMDPQDYRNLYVVDASSSVWATTDQGATWTNLTVNLPTLSTDVRTVEIFSPAASPINTVLIVGGSGGTYQMRRPGAAGTAWQLLPGLPHGLVLDLHYYYETNALIAGLLGRGAWKLSGYFRGGTTVPLIPLSVPRPFVQPNLPAPPPSTSAPNASDGASEATAVP